MKKIKKALNLIISGRASDLLVEIKKRFYSKTVFLGLSRDMSKPFTSPEAKIPITVRKLRHDDLIYLVDEDFTRENPELAEYQQSVVTSGLNTGYVAVDGKRNIPAYMQYLIGPDQNELIQSFFNGQLPNLKENEGLLGAAFMNPKFRGMRIMPAAMAQIAEQATEFGMDIVVTFVHIDNIPSLKGCHRAGFYPYVLREDKWFLFKWSINYKPLRKSFLQKYNLKMGISS